MDAAEDVVRRRAAEHLAQIRRDEVHRRDDDIDVVERHRQGHTSRCLARKILRRGPELHDLFPAPAPEDRGRLDGRPSFVSSQKCPAPCTTWPHRGETARRYPGT